MKIFIALSFVLLAVLYWTASGGPGFEPEAWPDEVAQSNEGVPAGASDVEVTRAEAPADDLVAPAPAAGVLTIEPALSAAAPAPPAPPEGLRETPVAPDEALAALAPDLAAGSGPNPALGPEPNSGASPGPIPTAAPEALVEAAVSGAALREVTGDRVNLREGPGTGFGVVGQLLRGEAAEVIELRDGWAWVRVGASEGWMSERFLAAP